MGVRTHQRWHVFATAAPPLLLTAILYLLQHTSEEILPASLPRVFKRGEEAQCPVDLWSKDACHQVREICPDFDDDGLIPYLRVYACTSQPWKPFVLILMLLWLPVLFGSMATAAADFLAVHLEYIVQTMGISENLAGVTLFAFGNGCTDLFATFGTCNACRVHIN
jgi:sodium/potassium/calcium exchanger 6